MEVDNEYKVFKSIRLIAPNQDGILEDNALADLLNEWYDRGYALRNMTTNTTLVGENLAMETTVILEYEDHYSGSSYEEGDYDEEDEDVEDEEDDEYGVEKY